MGCLLLVLGLLKEILYTIKMMLSCVFLRRTLGYSFSIWYTFIYWLIWQVWVSFSWLSSSYCTFKCPFMSRPGNKEFEEFVQKQFSFWNRCEWAAWCQIAAAITITTPRTSQPLAAELICVCRLNIITCFSTHFLQLCWTSELLCV